MICRREMLTRVLNGTGKIEKGRMINRLIAEGFCEAPASGTHHGNYEGGLFDHSFKVGQILNKLTHDNNLHWECHDSPEVIGILHDICKIDSYKKIPNYEIVNKGEIDQNEEIQSYTYEWNKNQLLTGHGEKSCIKALQMTVLSDEEIMCIRYHMGAFEGKHAWESYTNAVKRYPNILWVHMADMIASQVMGV